MKYLKIHLFYHSAETETSETLLVPTKLKTANLKGKCALCLANNIILCCKQVMHTATFRSNQTNRIFQICCDLNCKCSYEIYLLECAKCKIQHVGKAETELNIRFNNHRKDVWKPHAIPASRHFSGKNYKFNTHAKFILIEQIRHIDIAKEKNKERLKRSENVWILKLETLTSKSFNQELNQYCCMHHFYHLFSLFKYVLIFLNYYVINQLSHY